MREPRASTGRGSMPEVYIIAAVRTPIGSGKPETGALFPLAPVDLVAHVLHEAVRRADADPAQVEDVILGCVTPVDDQGANIARLAALKAGFPTHVPAVSLNRMCGSSQQAIHFASQAILAGDMELVIAGGIEMMSHQPLGRDYPKSWPADFPFRLVHQGISAEMMAELWKLNREQLDDFAFRSHERAGVAIQSGALSAQILPISITKDDGAVVKVERDQGVRIPPNREKMAALPPAFKPDGVVTAGNSSQVSDGAAAVLLASEAYVHQTGVTPLARVVARTVVGSDPVLMLDAPIPATRIVLERAGLKLDQIDLIEINEAFASVVLAWQKETHANLDLVNPDGGAIAHGHPLGATGAVLMTKLVDGLRRRNGHYGLQTMCIGHGMATATVIERL
jgi:acetyl-CoA acetyltransferase family protein